MEPKTACRHYQALGCLAHVTLVCCQKRTTPRCLLGLLFWRQANDKPVQKSTGNKYEKLNNHPVSKFHVYSNSRPLRRFFTSERTIMPIPSLISELSQTPGTNSPGSGESPITADDYFRTYSAFIATLRDGKGFANPVRIPVKRVYRGPL